MRTIAVVGEGTGLVRKYDCTWLLFSKLALSAPRFAPRSPSPSLSLCSQTPSSSLRSASLRSASLLARSFDANFTIHWLGYRSVDEYYEAASPSKHLSKVKTPLLIINSKNDPLIPHYVNPTEEDVQENPNLFVIESKYGGHIGFWTPFNGCYATQCFIKFSMLDNFKKQRARGTPEMRRRDSLEVSKRLSNSSNTNLSDYTIIRRVGESEESDGENVAYVGSSADEDEDEEEDEGQGGDDKKIEVPESPKHEDITANFVKGFA